MDTSMIKIPPLLIIKKEKEKRMILNHGFKNRTDH